MPKLLIFFFLPIKPGSSVAVCFILSFFFSTKKNKKKIRRQTVVGFWQWVGPNLSGTLGGLFRLVNVFVYSLNATYITCMNNTFFVVFEISFNSEKKKKKVFRIRYSYLLSFTTFSLGFFFFFFNSFFIFKTIDAYFTSLQ